jgi:MYXO-CTERM domain-containing protein
LKLVASVASGAFCLAASLLSLPALANASGLAGYTMKPNLSAPAGESCNSCHSGGTAPTVTLTGPASLTAGQIADYSLVVKTGSSRAAGAIAATDGVVLTPLSGVRDSFGEMVPNGSVAVSGGQATFTFRVTAPLSGNALRLWAVGLSANNNNGTSGDKAAHVLRDITVTGGSAPKPDAGTPGGGDPPVDPPADEADGGVAKPDASASGSGTSNGSSGPTGSSGSSSADPGADDGTDAPGSASPGRSGSSDAASCSSSASSPSRAPGTFGFVLALGAIGWIAVRRRRPRA